MAVNKNLDYEILEALLILARSHDSLMYALKFERIDKSLREIIDADGNNPEIDEIRKHQAESAELSEEKLNEALKRSDEFSDKISELLERLKGETEETHDGQ